MTWMNEWESEQMYVCLYSMGPICLRKDLILMKWQLSVIDFKSIRWRKKHSGVQDDWKNNQWLLCSDDSLP